MCGDEAICPWRGRDQRYAEDGCPHVTKIVRKPKGVGPEIKTLADCTTGVMLHLELMAPKEEMRQREYCPEHGSGTSLLLRLTKSWRASGRIVVADSAFASVKTAVKLKVINGLYFLGLVKTAHKMFPKQWLNEVPITLRGGHKALTATMEGVKLRAVAWNDGKKDKKTGTIKRKLVVGSCGTTLPGDGHKKLRWQVQDGHAQSYHVTVPRPMIVETYFDGTSEVDVHNHKRQGPKGCALETRPTHNWMHRILQTWLGMIEVDSCSAYKFFCPGKRQIKHTDFLRSLTQDLLDNKIGCLDTAPVLRPRKRTGDKHRVSGTVCTHSLQVLRNSPYFIGKMVAAAAPHHC